MPQIAFIPGPHAVGAAAASLDKDKDASAKTHPLQTVRAGKRIVKIRGSTGGRSFHEPVILSSKDGILESQLVERRAVIGSLRKQLISCQMLRRGFTVGRIAADVYQIQLFLDGFCFGRL